jgi:hypothetical protein
MLERRILVRSWMNAYDGAGFSAYLVKPFKIEDILKIVEETPKGHD